MSAEDTIPIPEVPPPTPKAEGAEEAGEEEEEPRITNEKVVGKKHREALKRLVKFNDEVRSRKAGEHSNSDREAPDREAPGEAPGPEDREDHEAPPPPESQGMSMSNVIAALGVGVAALCLYLSYTPYKPPGPPPRPPPNSPEAPPVSTRIRVPSQAPRFRRL